MKKLLLFMMAFIAVGAVKAKVVEKVLWTPSTASDIVISAYQDNTLRFAEDDIIRMYVGTSEISCHLRYSKDNGANYSILTGKEWPYISEGNSYAEVTLSSTDITALTDNENHQTKLYFGYNSGTANYNKITYVHNETETTLWETTEFGTAIANSFVAGDVIRVYCTVPSGGANIKVTYKSESDNNWQEHYLANASSGYPWLNSEDTYKDIELTSADITGIQDHYLYIGAYNVTAISKIALITSTPESTTELWSGTTTINWSSPATAVEVYKGTGNALTTAQIHDVIRITYESATASDNNIWIVNGSGWAELPDDAGQYDNVANTSGSLEFEIETGAILDIVRTNGIVISGRNATITKVELLKYNDRYDVSKLVIGEDRIATFGSNKAHDFTDSGVTPYLCTSVSSGSITLESVTTTHSWAGYVVKGNAGTYYIKVTETEPDWTDNFYYLRTTGPNAGTVYRSKFSDYDGGGDDETKIKTYYRYIFAKSGSDIGFYKLSETYTRIVDATTYYYHALGAHKAYLETSTDITPTGGGESRVGLIFDDGETTGINTVQGSAVKKVNDNQYFDLSGRRVAQPTKGLYIVNGKKVVIK